MSPESKLGSQKESNGRVAVTCMNASSHMTPVESELKFIVGPGSGVLWCRCHLSLLVPLNSTAPRLRFKEVVSMRLSFPILSYHHV